MKVIFLDIDGVLNAEDDFGENKPNPHFSYHRGISNEKLYRLKEIVEQTSAKIVLVSSWKVGYEKYLKDNENEIGLYLISKFKEVGLQIFETTLKYDTDKGESRGIEVALYLIDHKEITNYIVLDDDERIDYEKFNVLPHLIKTSPETGLTDTIKDKAIKELNDAHGY